VEKLELKIKFPLLNSIKGSIPEAEVREYLQDVSLMIYGISGLLQTCHKSIDDEDGYILRKSIALCFEGLNTLAQELNIGENSFKSQDNKINKVAELKLEIQNEQINQTN